jgi:hypothetical protein
MVLIGLLFCVVVCSAGVAALRWLRLPADFGDVGLIAPVGMALLVVVATWSTLTGLPALVATGLTVATSVAGFALLLRRFPHAWRLELNVSLVLIGGMLLSALVLGTVLADLQVPVSTVDGTYHVELIHALRSGMGWQGSWYPPGFHAMVAAFLMPLPLIDTASGAVGVSIGLTLLSLLGVFAFAAAVWRKPMLAAASTLLVAATYWYPYGLHLYSLWPMASGLILVWGLWAIALKYVHNPSLRWALLGGMVAGGITLAHTVEVYTAAIGLLVVLGANWRRLTWRRTLVHVSVACGLSLVLLTPYLPVLLGWAHSGGSADAGASMSATPVSRMGNSMDLVTLLVSELSGIVFDAPIRIALVAVGVWRCFRNRQARFLVPLGLVFVGLTVVLDYVQTPLIDRAFELTYPWSNGYRLLMVLAVPASLLGAAGLCWLTAAARSVVADRSIQKQAARSLIAIVAGAYALVLPIRFAADVAPYRTFSTDDAAAMAWLHASAQPGDEVLNDAETDAGIWAPYKASTTILMPHALPVTEPAERELVRAHVGQLHAVPGLLSAACRLGARYVYRGAVSPEPPVAQREFPSLAVLEQSPALIEVFKQGEAAVFRVAC